MISLLRVFFVFGMFFSSSAFAQGFPPSSILYDEGGQKFSSVGDACNAWWGKFSGDSQAYLGNGYIILGSGPQWTCQTNKNSFTAIVTTAPGGCPTGTTLQSDGMCWPNGTVPPPPCSDKNPYIIKFFMSENSPFPNHQANCNVVVDEVLVCRSETFNGVARAVCMLQIHRTGTQYTGAPDVTPNSDPSPDNKTAPKIQIPKTKAPDANSSCPAGSVQGGVDSGGIPICIGSGSNPDDPPVAPPTKTLPPVTVTNADGSTTTTLTKEQTNVDGSKTTTTTTTNTAADGAKTVSQTANTTDTADGRPGRTDSEEKDFCQKNPNLSICRDSSVVGSCGAIVCMGDAIQCAQLRAAAALECRDKQDRDEVGAHSLTGLGEAIGSGADPMGADLPTPANATVIQGPTTLDTSGFLGAGSFFLDKTFTIQGHSVTIPFSKSGPFLLALRYALMVVAALVSFKIIRGAVLT